MFLPLRPAPQAWHLSECDVRAVANTWRVTCFGSADVHRVRYWDNVVARGDSPGAHHYARLHLFPSSRKWRSVCEERRYGARPHLRCRQSRPARLMMRSRDLPAIPTRSEEHTSELQSQSNL